MFFKTGLSSQQTFWLVTVRKAQVLMILFKKGKRKKKNVSVLFNYSSKPCGQLTTMQSSRALKQPLLLSLTHVLLLLWHVKSPPWQRVIVLYPCWFNRTETCLWDPGLILRINVPNENSVSTHLNDNGNLGKVSYFKTLFLSFTAKQRCSIVNNYRRWGLVLKPKIYCTKRQWLHTAHLV